MSLIVMPFAIMTAEADVFLPDKGWNSSGEISPKPLKRVISGLAYTLPSRHGVPRQYKQHRVTFLLRTRKSGVCKMCRWPCLINSKLEEEGNQ